MGDLVAPGIFDWLYATKSNKTIALNKVTPHEGQVSGIGVQGCVANKCARPTPSPRGGRGFRYARRMQPASPTRSAKICKVRPECHRATVHILNGPLTTDCFGPELLPGIAPCGRHRKVS